ncbi:hypothetical protein [Nocardia salmonicida]|uniref:hypothetical protein n=1 Tax=Nocardia salmonicida TaxID=53431 RepID=UPI0033F74EC1
MSIACSGCPAQSVAVVVEVWIVGELFAGVDVGAEVSDGVHQGFGVDLSPAAGVRSFDEACQIGLWFVDELATFIDELTISVSGGTFGEQCQQHAFDEAADGDHGHAVAPLRWQVRASPVRLISVSAAG